MNTSYVWIVEIWDWKLGRWMPTVGFYFTRATAREERMRWEENVPLGKFRVRKYVAEQQPAKRMA